MALLQISEPDEVPAPKPRRRAIGIDLGTVSYTHLTLPTSDLV